MKRKALRGTRAVFSFTLRQFFRNKSNLATLAVLFVMALVSMPVMTYIQGGEVEETQPAAPAAVVLVNGTDLPVAEALAAHEFWGGTDFGAAAADITAAVTREETGYCIAVTGTGDGALMDRLEWDLSMVLSALRTAGAGLSAEQIAVLQSGFRIDNTAAPLPAEGGEQIPDGEFGPEEEEDGMGLFWVQYGYAIMVMMLCLLSSGYVIRTVVEEKGSKLIEVLLLSVEPLALLLGKILATMVYAAVMLCCGLLGYGASLGVTAALFGPESVSGIVEAVTALLPSLQSDPVRGALLAAAIVVSLLLAYLTMSLIGGLSGACCSSIEEAGSASTAVTMVTMLGYLGACVTSAFAQPGVAVFSALCPILSVFCAPVRYAQGHIAWWVLLLSWAVQLLVIAGLACITARVYRDLVIHRGSRIKWRQLWQMAAGRKEMA